MRNLTIIIITITTFLLACDKNKEPEKIYIPEIAKSYLFPAGEGSYYIYKDNFTLEVDTFNLDYFSEFFAIGFEGAQPFCTENKALQELRYTLTNTKNEDDYYSIVFSANCSADSLSGSLSKGPAAEGYIDLNSIEDIFYSNDTINSGGSLIYVQDTLILENYLFTNVFVFNSFIPGELYFVKDVGLVKASRLELIDYNLKP